MQIKPTLEKITFVREVTEGEQIPQKSLGIEDIANVNIEIITLDPKVKDFKKIEKIYQYLTGPKIPNYLLIFSDRGRNLAYEFLEEFNYLPDLKKKGISFQGNQI